MINSPILLTTFNRPNLTQKVFDAIKKIEPKRLYISNDGPREGNKKDKEARGKIKEMINQVNWECDVFNNFFDNNLGCGKSVSNAISWAFENEDRLIILEDDCVPSMSFFYFCDYCLEKYKNDKQVMQIAGNNYTEDHNYTEDDYFFSKIIHIWGWATWKRAWQHFDYEMLDYPKFRKTKRAYEVFKSRSQARYFNNAFEIYFNDKNYPWAMRWIYTITKLDGLGIVPRLNLVKNIGDFGTHSGKIFEYDVDLNTDFFVIKEPRLIYRNFKYDKYHFRNHINKKKPLFLRIYSRLKKILKYILDKFL